MNTAQPELQRTKVADSRPNAPPDRFFELMTGYQRTGALKAAMDLDLFTAVGKDHNTVSWLARRRSMVRWPRKVELSSSVVHQTVTAFLHGFQHCSL